VGVLREEEEGLEKMCCGVEGRRLPAAMGRRERRGKCMEMRRI